MHIRTAAPSWSASGAPRRTGRWIFLSPLWVPMTHSSRAQRPAFACWSAPASGMSTQSRASGACRIGHRRARPGQAWPQEATICCHIISQTFFSLDATKKLGSVLCSGPDVPDGVAPRHCTMKVLGTTILLCAYLSKPPTAVWMGASKIWCFRRLLGATGARHAQVDRFQTPISRLRS